MNNMFLLALIAFVISIVVTPFVKKFAMFTGVISIPKDDRRVHKKPMPLLGGLSIYAAFLVTVFLKKGNITIWEWGVVLGATIIVIGGFLDDKYEIKPWQKLFFQIAAACCLIGFGDRIKLLTNPFYNMNPYIDIDLWISIPFTMIWIIGITNALNLIDGLDGLAAGVGLISTITIFIVALLNGRQEAMYMTAILSGAILGFLPYNFNPASIFMGDTGSQLLGFLLAAISMEGAIKSATAFSIAVPILALGLPIYDTLFAMIRRKINGKPIMQADKGHLHHRLMDMGLSQKQAVIIMYLISAILGGIAILAMEITKASYILLAMVMLILVFLGWKFGFFKHNE